MTGAQAMRVLLSREPNIDAVVAGSDQIAIGAIGVAQRLGRRVPQDIAIVGFDDVPEAAFFWPSLTTVSQQLIDVGCLAVEKLHHIIEAKRRGEPDINLAPTVLTPELVVRESSVLV